MVREVGHFVPVNVVISLSKRPHPGESRGRLAAMKNTPLKAGAI
jgi:hypothetical protein